MIVLLTLAPLPAAAAGEESAPLPREKQPLGAATYVRRGLQLLARPHPEDQAEAERLLRKALKIDPRVAAAHMGIARVSVYLYSLGIAETAARLEMALQEARRAVDLAPDDAPARAVLALALTAADHLTPALEEARRAVQTDPGCAEAHAALCIVLRLREDLDESLGECRRAAQIDSDTPRILVALADVLRDLRQYHDAIVMYGQAIDLDKEAIVPQLGAAASFQKSGNLRTARKAYTQMLDKWDYALDRVRLGAASLQVTLQDYEGALEMYGRIAIPDDDSLPTLLALYGKGYCLLKLGRPAEAEYFLSALIERTPRDYDGPVRGRELLFRAYEDLAGYFEERGRDAKVEALLRSACERPLVPTRLARRLALRSPAAGAADEGGAILEKALLGSDPREDPLEIAESAIALARLRSPSGKKSLPKGSAAVQALTLAAERISGSPLGVAHYRMARAHALVHDGPAALASLERARQAGYMPRALLEQERDFDSLRGDAAFQDLLRP